MKIKSKHIFFEEEFQEKSITIENGTITSISDDFDDVDIDYEDAYIIPGMIDIHTHGAYGYDTNHPDPEGLKMWAKRLPEEGVTSFLPTTVTERKAVLEKALENVAKVMDEEYEGAQIVGIHFEGPYLSMKYKGAQPPEAIVPISIEEFKHYQDLANNHIKIITYAPEEDKDYAFTRYLNETGVIPSMGHSDATFDIAKEAKDNGAKSITHTYNAMRPFTHRDNGLVGFALYHHDFYSEIICDTYHSTPEAMHIFFTCKDEDHAIMITDSLLCKGYPTHTKFLFGNHEIEIQENGTAKLLDSGSLAGSTLKMNEGLKNVVEKANIDIKKAIKACTINPARLLGIDDHKGKLQNGYDADIVILDQNYEVLSTFIKGKQVYQR